MIYEMKTSDEFVSFVSSFECAYMKHVSICLQHKVLTRTFAFHRKIIDFENNVLIVL